MQQQRQPFLCYLPTNTPHTPAWVDEKYAAPYRKPELPAEFFGMIANLDENLGRLETFLRQTDLRENTVVLLLTDNGGTLGSTFYNAGLRARKTQIYERGHRSACFVRWPGGGFGAPRDVDNPAQMQDLLPTQLELCTVKPPSNAYFDGRSLAGVLRGKAKDLCRTRRRVRDRALPLAALAEAVADRGTPCTADDQGRAVGRQGITDRIGAVDGWYTPVCCEG